MNTAGTREPATIPLLGYNVWWGLKGIRVQRGDLLARMQDAGFAGFAPEPPTMATALKRAIKEWIKARGGAGAESADEDEPPEGRGSRAIRDLVRPINTRHSAHVVFALVGEHVDFAQLGLSYGTQARIMLEKLTPQERLARQPALICTTEATGVIAAESEVRRLTHELRPLWLRYQACYLSGDLSRMVRAIVDALPGAVCVRREGGLYFVPADQRGALLRLRALVEGLPTDGVNEPYLELIGVPDEQETRREMARAVHRGFLAELRALDRELDDLRGKAKAVQPDTVAARLAAYRAVSARASAYADMLGMQQSAIAEAISDLQGKARALLLSDDPPEVEETCISALGSGLGGEPVGAIGWAPAYSYPSNGASPASASPYQL